MKTKCRNRNFNKNKRLEVAKKEEKWTTILILATDRSHPLIKLTYHWLYIILKQFVDKLIVVVYSSRALHVNKTDWQYTWPRYWKFVEIHLHKQNFHESTTFFLWYDAMQLIRKTGKLRRPLCFLLQVSLRVLLYMPIPSADFPEMLVFIDKYTQPSLS